MITKLVQTECRLLSANAVNKCYNQMRHLSDTTTSRSTNESITSSFTSTQTEGVQERAAKRPVSYLPDHLPQNQKWILQKPWWRYRWIININTEDKKHTDWSETPEYPTLNDPTREGFKKDFRLEWYESIKRLPTAQQKEFEICKHYRHLSYFVEPVVCQYNSLPLQQYITRTYLISGHLPFDYNQMNVDHIVDDQLKRQILDSIALHLFQTKQRSPSIEFKTSFVPNICYYDLDQLSEDRVKIGAQEDTIHDCIAIVRKALQSKYIHLSNLQTDLDAYVCSSWWMNSFPIPFRKKKWFKDMDNMDQQFTYKGLHPLQLRSERPLPPVISPEDDICTKSEIPEYKHQLIPMGYKMKRHTFTNLPGFWCNHSNGFDFPNLICHSRHDLKIREIKNQKTFGDDQQVLDGMAIMSSFGWLNSLASNLGFTTYHELTYPLVTHVIITDGQFWSFYVYQLNTHSFHSDVDTNALRNICWSSGELKLFDSYENGQLVGVNDQVIKLLVKFLVREPQLENYCELRPYLSADNRDDWDIQELGYSLRRKYSNHVSSFVKKRQQIHLWEKIFKYHKEALPIPHIRSRPKMDFKYPPYYP
ncbi:28S ribosomal protein S30, mitochondrial-like [Oppia nitens]|uniref:28S ribosomal protein S30, mitochondrial-like n=1 Tax=Oppia nitens TaxID=1686743 RepID=UPI0023D9A28D|nr:28S ribosomal protein S30, mitochondrial-like [Oppia nitens]